MTMSVVMLLVLLVVFVAERASGFVLVQERRQSLIVQRAGDDSWAQELAKAAGKEEEPVPLWLKKQDPNAEARAKNEKLLEWLEENGVWVSEESGWNQAPHPLALATSTFDELEGEESGRGLVARRAITQDQELIRLPASLCLTKERAIEAGLSFKEENEYIAIAKLLIAEKNKKEQSFWSAYINVLPSLEEISPTFAWDIQDLESLKGSPCASATQSMRDKLERERNEFAADIHLKDWQWAFSILFSRAIRLTSPSTEILALVPYVDFINHSPFSSSYVGLQDSKPLFPWDPQDEPPSVVLYSDRSYKKFDQIFISYGPKSNADLLLLYGFALDRNPFNSVSVVFGANPSDPLYTQKKHFAESNGRQIANEAFPLYADRFPDEMLQYLRMLCTSKADLAPISSSSYDLANLDFSAILSTDNEIAVLDTIKAACEQALLSYPDQEDNPTPAAFMTRNLRMATRLVATEKRILTQTIQAATRKAAELKASVLQ